MPASRWPLLARGVASTILALAAILAARKELVPSAGPLLGACGFTIVYAAVLFLLESRYPARRTMLSSLALFLDSAALTVFLYFSGDLENPMRSLYVIPVIVGSLTQSRGMGIALAVWSAALFSGMVILTVLPALPHHHLDILEGLLLHELIREETNPGATGYLLLQLGYFSLLMFGSALAFGTLSRQLRAKQAEVREEHERMTLLLGTLPEGVVLLDGSGKVLLANRVAQDFLEGRAISEMEADLGVLKRLEDRSKTLQQFETTTGKRVLNHVLARSAPERPAVWVFRDMTEQNRLLGQMIHRSKMADLGLLAAGIAHEVGNPLSSMSAILQILRMKSSPETLDERLQALLGHVDRITRIVRQVSEFARPSTGDRTSVDLEQAARKAVEIFQFHRKSKGLTVNVQKEGDVAQVSGVEDQLVQVVLNLLLNAAHASADEAALEILITPGSEGVRLSVRDRGAGMPEETVRRMFLPFFTTKDQGEGVGLGLFVCDTIARNHGGRFQVESSPGSGTTVTLHLPAAKEDS